MSENETENKPEKKRRKKKKGSVLSTIILVIALVVFGVSAFNLIKYGKGYATGRAEYSKIRDMAIEGGEEGEDGKPKKEFKVNFKKLLKVNPDTVAWIRFHPKPSEINDPVVQGKDNQEYLHKTFSANENTLGAIFLAAENRGNFMDQNSVIYGHRMNDRSMFWHLEDYTDPKFYKKYPCFYIYTPDGDKRTYRIFSTCVVEDMSDTYKTKFFSEEEFESFLKMTKSTAEYDTGVEVDKDDLIVTLSTCTSADDNHRYVVRGVLEERIKLMEE